MREEGIKDKNNRISTNVALLWHILMSINYQNGWQKEFAVKAYVLANKVGVSSQTIRKLRSELEKKGRHTP